MTSPMHSPLQSPLQPVMRSPLELRRRGGDSDLSSDKRSPYFVNLWEFTKSHSTPSSQNEVSILSRDSDSSFTVESGGGAQMPGNNGAVVVLDSTGKCTSYPVTSLSGDTVTVSGVLPASISAAQTMHDSVTGQHLSRFGYKGMADFIVDRTQKYSYKKDSLIFYYHPPITKSIVWSNPNIYALDGTTLLISPTLIGGAGNGGYVVGTSTLNKVCVASDGDYSASNSATSVYLSRKYNVADSGAGKGIEITFSVGGEDGFVEVPVSSSRVAYDTTLVTLGRVRLEVLGDGVSIFDQTYTNGLSAYPCIDFSGVETITVRVTLADSVPSSVNLLGIYAYKKSANTSTDGYFSGGDVVAFVGDSWTQHPVALGGETKPLRPDGSECDGMAFLPARLKDRLADDGISITTHNMGKGGMTSAWGLHWIDNIASLSPKPTHCVICFFVNDYNSGGYAISGADSPYDYNPASQWATLVQSSSGNKGAVTVDEWFANMQAMCSSLVASGIKPIVLMPGHTASVSQMQSIQQVCLNKIAAGFNTINEDGGRD